MLGENVEPAGRSLAFWTAAKSFPGFLPVAARVWAPVTPRPALIRLAEALPG